MSLCNLRRLLPVFFLMLVLPGAAQGARYAIIDSREVDVRQGPGRTYPVLKKLYQGDRVLSSNQAVEGFFKIRTRSGVVGWVPSEAIAPDTGQPSRGARSGGTDAPIEDQAGAELPPEPGSERLSADEAPPTAGTRSGEGGGRSGGNSLLGINAGYGLSSGYGLGFGLQGTWYFGDAFSLSARGEYFLGSSESVAVLNTVQTTSASLWMGGAEIGYDLELDSDIRFRPLFLLGMSGISVSTSLGSASTMEFTLAPGALLMFGTPKDGFFGIELTLRIIGNGSGLVAMAGYHFGI